jgi:hypothetical protein
MTNHLPAVTPTTLDWNTLFTGSWEHFQKYDKIIKITGSEGCQFVIRFKVQEIEVFEITDQIAPTKSCLPVLSELSVSENRKKRVNPFCDRPRYETSVDEFPCQPCSPRHRILGSGIDVVLVGPIAAWEHVSERGVR